MTYEDWLKKNHPVTNGWPGEDQPLPFRVGRNVHRNVYWGNELVFMAATDERARELVALLNKGQAAK